MHNWPRIFDRKRGEKRFPEAKKKNQQRSPKDRFVPPEAMMENLAKGYKQRNKYLVDLWRMDTGTKIDFFTNKIPLLKNWKTCSQRPFRLKTTSQPWIEKIHVLFFRVGLSRVGTSQDVPSSFHAGYIFEYFAVLTSFRTSFQRSETGLNRSVLDFFSTLLWKPVSKPVFTFQKPVYTRKYSTIRWSEMAPEHPGMFWPLRGRLNFVL